MPGLARDQLEAATAGFGVTSDLLPPTISLIVAPSFFPRANHAPHRAARKCQTRYVIYAA